LGQLFQTLHQAVVAAMAAAFLNVRVLPFAMTFRMRAVPLSMQRGRQSVGEFVYGLIKRGGRSC
jgi:hypothetical protein